MKSLNCAIALLAGTSLLSAQETESQRSLTEIPAIIEAPARLTSPIADGTPSEPVPEPERPKFRIHWETKIRQGGRAVTIQEVETPIFPKSLEVEAASIPQLSAEEIKELLSQRADGIPQHFVSVSATIYDRRATHLRIWSHDGERREPIEAWSNADWNFLGGFASFEGRGQNFTFLMFPGNSSIRALRQAKRQNPEIVVPKIPEDLPQYRQSGARYVVMNHDEANETALEFLESVHDLYEAEKPMLVRAYRKREYQRKLRAEELRRNPPKPEDIEISFWNNDANK